MHVEKIKNKMKKIQPLELVKQIKARLRTKWNRAKGTNKSSKVTFFMSGTPSFTGGVG